MLICNAVINHVLNRRKREKDIMSAKRRKRFFPKKLSLDTKYLPIPNWGKRGLTSRKGERAKKPKENTPDWMRTIAHPSYY